MLRLHLEEIARPYDIAITVFAGELLVLPQPELEKQVLGVLAKESLLG